MNSIPIKVLVIDDESPIRKLLRMGLSAQGYDVVEAQDGKIALELLRRLLLGGVGWCGMPEPLVRADIESKRLVRLNLPDWRGGGHKLQAIHQIDTPLGAAGRENGGAVR
jgi:CheY-like chemotaxis protein